MFTLVLAIRDPGVSFWLEKAFQERSYYMSYLKGVSGELDTFAFGQTPRFDDLLRRYLGGTPTS
jgi:hypothetical protein